MGELAPVLHLPDLEVTSGAATACATHGTVGYSYHKKPSCAAIKSVKGVWGGGFFRTQKREKTKGGDVLGGGEEEFKKKNIAIRGYKEGGGDT